MSLTVKFSTKPLSDYAGKTFVDVLHNQDGVISEFNCPSTDGQAIFLELHRIQEWAKGRENEIIVYVMMYT